MNTTKAETIKANARYILKGYKIPAECYSDNCKPTGILFEDLRGRRFYVGVEFWQTIIDAGYTIVNREKTEAEIKEVLEKLEEELAA